MGSVLVVTLWVALGLVAIAVYFGHSMVLEYRVSGNRLASAQAQQAIEGARRYLGFVLEEVETAGEMPDEEDYSFEAVAVDQAMFWLVGREDEELLLESDTPAYGLVDEASKLNLNTATVEMLEALPYMTAELAASIVDWRDTDAEVSANGAESETYLLLEPAYNAKDGNFESPEELRLVYGADLELLYGEDVNRNGVLDANEDDGDESYPPDDANGILRRGILAYVTTFSREPNTREDGSARVNLSGQSTQTGDRQPPPEGQEKQVEEGGEQGMTLTDLLVEVFGDARGQEIVQALGAEAGNLGSALEFYLRSGISEEEFDEVDDALTTQEGDYVMGLVNVNTASRDVLACIPGIGEEYADELVSVRSGREAEELTTVAWVTEVLPEENAVLAGPYLTAKSYVFGADVVAVGLNGRGFRRDWLVLDTAGDGVTLVYRRDLTRCGWPLGDATYAELADLADEGGFSL